MNNLKKNLEFGKPTHKHHLIKSFSDFALHYLQINNKKYIFQKQNNFTKKMCGKAGS